MDHDGARRLMAESVEGRLAQSDERELALHLVSCSECKTLYEGLQHAHPALATIAAGPPPTRAVDTAVHRATTVLSGEADPGPLGQTRTDTDSAEAEPTPGWTEATAPLLPDDAVAIGERETETKDGPAPFDEIAEIESPGAKPPQAERLIDLPAPTPIIHKEEATAADETEEADKTATPLPPILPPTPPTPVLAPEPLLDRGSTRSGSASPGRVARRAEKGAGIDEVEELLDEDYAVEPVVVPRPPARERPSIGPGPWLAAIAVTIALAVLAGVLITRGQGLIGGATDLPGTEDVRSRVERLFSDMRSLKTSFTIQRLGLYRVGQEEGSLVYSFSNGRYSGRFVYDRAEGYREEVALSVRDRELDSVRVVQSADETRSLHGEGAGAQLLVLQRPPLGPPDGSFRPALGFLEESVGFAARLLAGAQGIEVVGRTTLGERDLYQVRSTVQPDELSRADRIDFFLDSRTFFPVVIQRSISRSEAHVLGPGDVISDEAIDTAFGDRDRIMTESVELENVIIDDIVLPGDFVLDVPDGVEPQTEDGAFERVTSAQLRERLTFSPLLPRSLPQGFEEQAAAVYTGEPAGWGPAGRLPVPDGVAHTSYFDGRNTIVITQRHIPSGPFALDGSPLQGDGLEISVRPVQRAEKRFFFGSSPETPPHAYGFLGNVFVMVVGYLPAESLIDILGSLGEAPEQVPADAPPDEDAEPDAEGEPTATPAQGLPGEP